MSRQKKASPKQRVRKKSAKSYLNNKLLKAAGVQMEFTPEQLEEYRKCAANPIYFIQNYVKIVNVDRGVVPFVLHDFQKKIVKTIYQNRFTIAKLPRQCGKSTTCAATLLHMILFTQETKVALLAHKMSTAKEILNRIKKAYELLPQWIQQGVVEWNKFSITLENGSKILAAATSSSAVRGDSFNCITGDACVTIRHQTGEVANVTIEKLFETLQGVDEQGSRQTTKWCMRRGIEVFTPEGFKPFEGITREANRHTIKLTFADGSTIQCTPDHKVAREDGWVIASKLKVGDRIVCETGLVSITAIIAAEKTYVYDLLNVKDTHAFYANGKYFSNCIVLDEFAHVPEHIADEFFSSVYPTISSGKTTKMIVISTPKGMNMFYKLWNDAQNGRNTYKPIEIHWSEVPGRDEAWKKQEIANTSPEQFAQEQDGDFLGSAHTLVSTAKLKTMSFNTPLFDNGEGYKVYKMPEPDHIYAMLVDSSGGQGNDYHAFSIIDVTSVPYRLVATYRNNKLSPLVMPNVIYAAGMQYNCAHILVEINNEGSEIANILHSELEYEHLMTVTMRGRKGQSIDGGFGGGQSQFGVKMSEVVKRIGCSIAKSLIEENKLIIEDYDTIRELFTFVAKKGSFEAETGHNDDTCMTLVLFGWLTAQSYFKDMSDIDVRRDIYKEKIRELEESMVVFGFIDNGIDREAETVVDEQGTVWQAVQEHGW